MKTKMRPGKNGFHLSENGPAPCDAVDRACSVGAHFSGANALDQAEAHWKDVMMPSALAGHRSEPLSEITTAPVFRSVRDELDDQLQEHKEKKTVMSVEEASLRHGEVENLVRSLVERGSTTDIMFTRRSRSSGEREYTEERIRQHQELISRLLYRYKDVPKQGKAIVAGGLGALVSQLC